MYAFLQTGNLKGMEIGTHKIEKKIEYGGGQDRICV
jgi:hypothetical protein